MALFSRQFEGLFDLTEVTQITVTIASTAAGASSVTANQAIASSGAAVGDICLVSSPVNTAGAQLTASVVAAGTFVLTVVNPTGGSTFNPGAQTYTVYVFRSSFKGAS
jgi:hypothetical protein